jgi:hypothetical protein
MVGDTHRMTFVQQGLSLAHLAILFSNAVNGNVLMSCVLIAVCFCVVISGCSVVFRAGCFTSIALKYWIPLQGIALKYWFPLQGTVLMY